MIRSTVYCTYYTAHRQGCYILLPHDSKTSSGRLIQLAQAYFDAKYGRGSYGSTLKTAVSVEENSPARHLEPYALEELKGKKS